MSKYTLLITEKPDAAARIAAALDQKGKPERNQKNGVPYFRVWRNGEIVVVSAIGHLYTIKSIKKSSSFPVFDYKWVPRWQAEKKASRIRTWLKVISDLAMDAERFVDGCDFDTEGSIIGYTILKYACSEKQTVAKRMKYSTLTTEELQQAYANLMPHLDFAIVQSGLTRHEIDWLYGINLSRALTQAAKKASGSYSTLSTGRVQGPTLRFLEEREKEICTFVPAPYWKLKARITLGDRDFDAEHTGTLQIKAEAEEFKRQCKTKTGKIQIVKVSETDVLPPVPFDLGALQSEAYKLFRINPVKTSSILQRLYINAVISYPRTSSQKLPASIGYKQILKKLTSDLSYNRNATELLAKRDLKPNEGKKFDPAHPAIYPTGNLPQKPLDELSKKVFDLVVKRFMAVFADPAVRQNIEVIVDVNGVPFRFGLARTLREGWYRFYQPYVQVKDDKIPTLIEGTTVDVKRVTLKEHFTQPPPRYNPRSLLQKMEKEEIGTKATRAAIIQTLHDRKYLTGSDSFCVSGLGLEVTEVLEKICPEVTSLDMTRELEQKMDAIQSGSETKDAVLKNAVETLQQVLAELKDKEDVVGAQLSEAVVRARQMERSVGKCPTCKDGELMLIHSKKTGKRFVGCNNYFNSKCSTAYPLPQTGTIKPLAAQCKSCGAPVISVYYAARKPWRLCLNPKCPTKETNKP